MELDQKAIEALKAIGITEEILKKDAADIKKAAGDFFEPLHKSRIEKILRAEIEAETKEKHEAAIKDAQIGAQNAAKSKIVDAFPNLGLSKAEASKLSVEELAKKAKEKYEAADKSADNSKELAEKLQKMEMENQELLKLKESLPALIESAKSQTLDEYQTKGKYKELLQELKPRINLQDIETVEDLLKIKFEREGIRFKRVVEGGTDKLVLEKKATKDGKPLKDKEGNDIYVSFQKDSTSNWETKEYIQTVLLEKGLLKNQDTPNSNNPSAPIPKPDAQQSNREHWGLAPRANPWTVKPV